MKQLLSLGKRIAAGSSSTTGSSSSSSTSADIFGGQEKKIAVMGYNVPKKLVYKFKSHLKQAAAIGFHNKDKSPSAKYSYDMQSYSLNFDDGLYK
ncbi:hypothetical protein LINGRAHAP2_LOCUS15183 [Linum grandiflorum]